MYEFRPVVPGGAGAPNNTGTSGFSGLPAALNTSKISRENNKGMKIRKKLKYILIIVLLHKCFFPYPIFNWCLLCKIELFLSQLNFFVP